MKLTDINFIAVYPQKKSVSKGNEKEVQIFFDQSKSRILNPALWLVGHHFAAVCMQVALFGDPGENPESLELVEPLLFWAEVLQGTLEDLLIKLGWEILAARGIVSKPLLVLLFLFVFAGKQSVDTCKQSADAGKQSADAGKQSLVAKQSADAGKQSADAGKQTADKA